jgi:hypothetical protein
MLQQTPLAAAQTGLISRVVDRGQFFNRSVGRSVRPPQTDRSVGPFGPTYVDLRTMCGLHGTWYRGIPNMYHVHQTSIHNTQYTVDEISFFFRHQELL